ncbi:MAG: tRNA (adenosine(37)-N6)-threonylcarbamoyltransferase complex ATPase subunit type 1 TsaE [Prevotellaceae bacterium]|jgi:tRNA threonylcarbamoyladenosine biosynthesis protein TsaE|nr:tRNA (adenosine(37)-N6)-threonylcarbamoyltransferase complex ATPase subunit type 1 TsaE [Prevotellaceae bacterium]
MIFHSTLENIEDTAKKFIEQIGSNRVFAFNGEMGAGKTTFIKAICELLGVKEPVNSPTFSIVNEYVAESGKIIYHFDCYRINDVKEALNIGAEEYLYSGNLCFIEWAENIAPILPEHTVNVDIQIVDDKTRRLIMKDE